MSLKLEVGKKYLNRIGDICKIVRIENGIVFTDDYKTELTPTGRYYNDNTDHELDLVSEYVEPIKSENLIMTGTIDFIKQKRYELAKDILIAIIKSPKNLRSNHSGSTDFVKMAFEDADEFLKQWNEGVEK